MEKKDNSDIVNTIESSSDIDFFNSQQILSNFQNLKTFHNTTDSIYEKKSKLMRKPYCITNLNTQEMIEALEKNGTEDEVDPSIGGSCENKCMLEDLKKEVKKLKTLLEDKEKQLETAAKYGITLLKNNESLQELLEKNEEMWKLKLEVV